MVTLPWNSGKLLLSWVFGVLACWADASLVDNYINLPPEIAARVPARLVFSQAELIQCWQEPTARRCVLKGDIELTEDVWRQAFQASRGVAPVRLLPDLFTVTSDPCTARGLCLPGQYSEAYTVDFNGMSYAMSVQRNAIFVMTSVQLFDLAPVTAYTYSSSTPWKSTGGGTTTWPSIGLAPNATLALVNSSVLYLNPSDTEDCVVYTQQRNFAFRQLWGEGNVVVLNASANVVVGPTIRKATIRNGSTDDIVGIAHIYYRNVTFICMENTTPASQSGLSSSTLAVAIAVPVGVVLLAGCLLAACCFKRRRRPKQQSQHALDPKGKSGAPAAAYVCADVEAGQADYDDAQVYNAREQVTLSVDQKKDVCNTGDILVPAAGMHDASNHSADAVCGADTGQPPSLTPDSTRHNSQALQGSGGTHDVSTFSTAAGSHRPALQSSGGTYDISTFSTAAGSQRFGSSVSLSSRATGMDERLSNVSALLKARSDMSMLRDLKVGPLLGRGSYGRVYRGRWKATPVAVKIIEHRVGGAGSSDGKGTSAGRETLLATSVSHPNVVTTYHISTMSLSERSALASSWLEGGGPSSSQHEVQDSKLDGNDDSEGSTVSSFDEPAPDMLETWIIMEFCEKGSLERAVRLGKFKQVETPRQMVAIYKALLDTASGLDYLHSIGVVHGDLKTANVLLKGSTKDARSVTCKITDFGLSRVLDLDAKHISTGTYGTIVYMPKELLLSGRMTQATDIYSFGLMMWEMFTSQPVMDADLTVGQMFYMIAYGDWRPEVPPACPQPYAELMCACWHEDPDQRPTAQQLLGRLQKLYLPAKQQYLAARGGRPPTRSSSRSSLRRSAAAAAVVTQGSEGTARTSTPFPSGGSGGSGGLGPPPAADGNSGGSHPAFSMPAAQQGPQQGRVLGQQTLGTPSLQDEASVRLSASVDRAVVPAPHMGAVRGSCSTKGNDRTADYEPYAKTVLQRSTSLSSAMLAQVPAQVVPCAPMQTDQLGRLQQQLAHTQDAAAQQQLLQSCAVFVPPMRPFAVLPAEPGTSPSTVSTQQAVVWDHNEDTMFDEDGLASEGFLRHLTNPSNALYTTTDFGGVKFEDQFSGYLHPPGPADRAQETAGAQSMQEAVEQYRQQLQLLQQRVTQGQQ